MIVPKLSRVFQMLAMLPPLFVMSPAVAKPAATARPTASVTVKALSRSALRRRFDALTLSLTTCGRPANVAATSMSVRRAKAVMPIVERCRSQRGDDDLVCGGDGAAGVGVGGEVLAPPAVDGVVAEPAEQDPGAGRLGRKIQGDVDRVGVPDRDTEDGEDLWQQAQRVGVAGVGRSRVGIERQVGAVSLEVLGVHPHPADVVVVEPRGTCRPDKAPLSSVLVPYSSPVFLTWMLTVACSPVGGT